MLGADAAAGGKLGNELEGTVGLCRRDGGTRGERGAVDLPIPVSPALCRPHVLCPPIPWDHLPGTIGRGPTLDPHSLRASHGEELPWPLSLQTQ